MTYLRLALLDERDFDVGEVDRVREDRLVV